MPLDITFIVIFKRAALEPTRNNNCGPLPRKFGNFCFVMYNCNFSNFYETHDCVKSFVENSYS